MKPAPESRSPTAWHALDAAAVTEKLGSDASEGLTTAAAIPRLARYGSNCLPPPRRRGPGLRLALQFHNPLIYVLLAAAAITLGLRDYLDTAVIVGVVIINAVIGFVQEGRAEQALEAVRSLLANRATVVRDGERHDIDAAELVPGDLVVLESGDRVPADLRLLQVRDLHIDEAALTGESLPVAKQVARVAASAAIGDRLDVAHAGTVVSRGQGRGIVVATGAATEIGHIGALVAGVGSLTTPLTRQLDRFARRITAFILVLGAVAFAWGHYVAHMAMLDIFLAVVGLAVAAIPEGLPAIVTITLAIGTNAMARQRAVVRRLPAVETLGSVTVICTDKTGTLTRNEMTAVTLLLPDRAVTVSGAGYAPEGGFQQAEAPLDPARDPALLGLARCALLCNDARLHRTDAGDWVLSGDPTEGALVTLALKAGLTVHEETAAAPRVDEIPFTSEQRFMATLHHDHRGHAFMLLKGAPETILPLCLSDAAGEPVDHAAWEARMQAAATSGERLLALARRELPDASGMLTLDAIAPGFTLLGIVGMLDPPRPEAISAVAQCREAGIRTLMVTGDHAATATAIARQLGLAGDQPLTGAVLESLDDAALAARIATTDVIARASPEHKLRLVRILQASGELVAMTGDGVNDAPALKAADIGVAMGRRGTDAAREAADLVLTDDNFATIAAAVREGRTVFDNIRKSLLFILPTNGGEAGVILLAIFAGLALPVTAGQILWINMVTTVTLALALAFEPTEPDAMQRPPRPPAEPLITRAFLGRILYVSLLMIAATFGVFEWQLARGGDVDSARTMAVNMLAFGELAYLFNVRQFAAPALSRAILEGNRAVLWAGAALISLQLLFTYTPLAQRLFQVTPLDAWSWLVILAAALGIFIAVAAEKWLFGRRGRRMAAGH
ncbi:MAG: HAD-IC family P-type ATPase [Gammaproteobacteria bacterium]|nr:HAD-IC family P-type ATPase [Gammaproteobacteria bacterium]